MITRKMIPEYLKYILPTMLTFTLAGIYSIVDGIFVGHAVGDAGLAGINVAYPLVCLILAVGTGLGMGGGVISSIARGEGNSARATRVIGVTLFMLFAASIPILMLYILFAEQLCAALGGQGETLVQAVHYLQVIAVGAPFQVLVTGCTPLIRNRGQVAYAMAVQLFAGVINVVLDYVFVMQWGRGTAGAAEATVVAQIVAFLFVLAFFARRDNRIPLRDFAARRVHLRAHREARRRTVWPYAFARGVHGREQHQPVVLRRRGGAGGLCGHRVRGVLRADHDPKRR